MFETLTLKEKEGKPAAIDKDGVLSRLVKTGRPPMVFGGTD
jgi:hypothetical protein